MSSENLKRYIWETQIVPQLGYSFSDIHSTGYSLIALQMMNLEHHYPSVFWNTACLSVGASADEEVQNNKSTDYGKIASAISRMQSQNITIALPDINKSKFGFTPDVENNQILFGLKGINSIGDDMAHAIIENRPYSSFEDFYRRMYETKIIQKSQTIKLIKAGAFNCFNSPIEIMKQFIVKEVDVKESLNGQNLPKIISLGLLDNPEYKQYQDYYNFRKHLMKTVHHTTEKPKDKIYIIKDNYSQVYFENNFTSDSVVGDDNGRLLISDKLFKKEYDTRMEAIKVLYKDEDFVRSFNNHQFFEIWNSNVGSTNIPSWEMEACSFYSTAHELDGVDYNRYGLSNFFELSEEPVIISENTSKNGRVYKNMQLFNLVGTFVDKNKNSHSIVLNTPHGIVNCKLNNGAFSFYDKRISKIENGTKKNIESSWFAMGTKLLVRGYRKGDQFFLKSLPNEHTINKILEVRSDGTLSLQSERARV